MPTSYRAFQIELYEEYLSNCAFLSDQRRNLLAQPCGKWGLLRDWEDRIEAQIDGLVVGRELALQVCQRRALEGEPGEFETALRVFVRQSKFDLIEETVATAKVSDGPKTAAIAEGLLHEPHPDLLNVIQRLIEMDASLLPVLARVIGYQRLPLGSLLLASQSSHPTVVWALGRLREQGAVGMLCSLLGSLPEKEKGVVALALLRITNDRRASGHWPLFFQGLLGERAYTNDLLSDASADSSLGLGLLGDTAAIPSLISRLPQPEAALALQLITGAELTMQTPIGETPQDGEDLEPGERPTMETKIETSPEAWSAWWQDNQENLPTACLSCGRSATPETLLHHLWSPERLNVERYWLVEQLALRHGQVLGAEMDMYLKEQRIALPGIASN
jgi:hypothetical protein